MTSDLASVILYLRTIAPAAPFFGLGFSMGAGLLTHYLSETGENSGLNAGFAVSNGKKVFCRKPNRPNGIFS